MADDLGGLFDSDPGFLEELASGTNEPQQQSAMPGIHPQSSGQMPAMMQPGHPHTGYNMAGMQPQQQQQGTGYTNMQYQAAQQPQNQPFNQPNYSQYNNQPVYNQSMTVSTPSQKQGMMNQAGMMSPTHRNQFGSPPAGMVHQGQVMYQYNQGASQSGPRLPNPVQQSQQQMKMAQVQGWNQNQQMFNPQQQTQQQPPQQQQYIQQQHNFNHSNSSKPQIHLQPQLTGAQSGQNQAMYMQQQRMTSPTSIHRMPNMNNSQQNTIGMPNQMYLHGNQNFSSMNMTPASMPNDPMRMQQAKPQQFVIQQQQPNQQFQPQQQQQTFQYQQQMQQNQQQQSQQVIGDNSVNSQQQQNMMRFPKTSPSQASVPQQRMQFNNMNTVSQQRASVPILSPRPTPPPASPSLTSGMLSPTGSTSSHQGGFNSLEPSPNHSQQNSGSMFQSNSDMNDQQNLQFNQGMNQSTNPPNGAHAMNVTVNTNTMDGITASQTSPVKKVLSPNAPVLSPGNKNMELQNLNQQIQQLYSMPQTPQTQQKLLDLQEKAQQIKSQHMQQSPRPGQQMQQSPRPVQPMQQSPRPVQSMQQSPHPGQQVQQSFQSSATSVQQPASATQPPKIVSPTQPPQSQPVMATTAVVSQPQINTSISQQPVQQTQHVPASQVVVVSNQATKVPQAVTGPQISPVPGTGMVQQGTGIVQQAGQIVQVGQNGQQIIQQNIQPLPQLVQSGQVVRLVQTGQGNQNQQQKIFIIQQPGQRMPNPQLPQQQVPVQQQQPSQQQTLLSSQPPQTVLATQVPTLTSLPQPVLNGTTQQVTQSIVIKPAPAGTVPAQQTVMIQSAGVIPAQTQIINENSATNGDNGNQQQEKANKIIAEAIAKAQKSGNTAIPRVLQPPELPASLGDLDNPEQLPEETGKKKKKRKYTPKKDKGEKSSGEKSEKTPKKKKKKSDKADKADKSIIEDVVTSTTAEVIPSVASEANLDVDMSSEGDTLKIDLGSEEKVKKPKKKKDKKHVATPRSEKKKSKKPPATFLKNKKRKRRGSSEGSDNEIKVTPPPSPENDEFKRRSGRNVKRKKYMDDVDLNLSEEDTIDAPSQEPEGAVVKPENPAEEDAVVVDKILGARMRKPDPDEETDMEEVEEFFVKYKNFSYLHCEWRTEAEIRDKRIQGKIKRYKMKKYQVNDVFVDDDELFNPDYVEVDRVLEESKTIDPNTEEEVTHYLVKWRSLAYEDSTWELQQDVDPEKVKQFKIYRELPPEEDQGHKPRPKASEWKALKETHTYKNENTLREYQLEGVNWLTFNWYKKQNCILADEMGLGKTIQSITFLQEIFTYGIRGPFLVVAPLSTIANWQREFETWTDINAITYHGTSPSRYMLQEYEMYYRDDEGGKITDFYKFHAIITTYEIILSDLELLKTIDWRCIIIDEAHRLKNKNCSLIKCLRSFDFEHKVLLSGTPLQNNVEELFSLLNFLEPSQFTSSDAFLAEFGKLQTEEQVDKLKAILKPMMLRRLKEDVEKNIARKEETIIEVELTNIQKKYYRAILEKNFSYLCKGANSTNVPSLLNTMMELRKCCNHPYLLNGAEENILSELRMKEGKEPEHIQALIQASGKFVLLDKLLPNLKQNGHRVLIFSQMIRVLDIIEDYLISKKYLYERLDGRIRGNLRQEAIDRYSKPDSDRFVFLICTKAGGLGINLTAADTVIIYDSDWNPQNDLQAQARCHRIGQSKMVKVYRLITRNSYEREMFNRASMKLGLDKAVLQSMGGEKISPQQQLSKREIEDLLRKGAYGALMDDDEAGDKFCEEDIEQILKGRTQVIEIESEGKGSTFSKASFSVTGNREDIDISDPDFWQKWAKKADVDTEMLETKELIVDEPRVRKRTARYGNNDNLADMSDLGSDSDSDNEDKKGKKGRRSRKGDEDEDFEKERHRAKPVGTGYGRSELFKVEKGLLHYGWGRWSDILGHARFKRQMEEKDVENVAKAILLYGLQYYKGDERIKEFISDLIAQEKEGGLKNHSGLSAPVPRGRKGKKARDQEVHFDANEEIEKAGIKMDRDIIFNKNAYKRHIHRHSNKVLLRVRTLYYLKHEVLGEYVNLIDEGKHVKDIPLSAPIADNEPPTLWWDELADKSLLVGVYKHGYEKYNLMRQDPMLVFLDRCGPPDNAALAAEMKDDDDNENDDLDETSMLKDDDDEESLTCSSDITATPSKAPATASGEKQGEGQELEEGKLPFPTASEMNTRLRRIITTYQRDFKKQQQKKEQQAKKMEKREKLDAVFREREARKKQTQMKWTRREETDFYRVVSTYGIEFDRHKGRYIWDKFRVMARLDKKTDEQLTEYFISFYHMCLRVCRKIKEEAYPPTPVYIEPITEERANRCIARIDLLSKIREEIIVHPKMEQRVKLCQKSIDLPTWWKCGQHDRELLVGAAKHGLARTDYYIMNDKGLSFHDVIKGFIQKHSNSPADFKMFGKDLEKKDVKSEKDEKPEVKSEDDKDEKSDKDPKDETDKSSDEKDESVKVERVKTEGIEDDDEQTIPSADDSEDLKDNKSSPVKDNESESATTKSVKKEKTDSESEKDDTVDNDSSDKKDKDDDVESDSKSKAMDVDNDDEDTDIGENMEVDEVAEKSTEKSKEKSPTKQEKSDDKSEVKEEKEIKDEVKEEMKKEIKDEDDLKSEADEEVRLALEDEESGLFASVSQNLLAQWPKDRVVFHRLEQICYCVETGDWPFPPKMKNLHILGIDSNSNTPTRSMTPQTPKLEEESREGKDTPVPKPTQKEKDFEVQMAEGEGLKMTFHKKPEKNRRSMPDPAVEAEKAARIQAILAQSIAQSQASSDDSQQDSILSSMSQSGADSPFLNGGPPMSEEEMMMNRHLLEQGLLFPRQGRRGRKRKEEKMAEIAMAEALARRQTARALSNIDSDSRVPVINLEDGSRLSGEEAPLKKNIEKWLIQHPGYMVDSRVEDLEEGEILADYPERRKGRKPKFDPAYLEVDKLTGEENVSVIHRLNGKKITGAKAPPLRFLAEWLEQNPMWDVDPKWSELVRQKGSLPKTLLPRIGTPSRRGRKPRDSPLSHPMLGNLGTSDPHQAAALAASMEAMNAAQLMAAGFGKLPLPFGSIPGLGLNPMLGLTGFPAFPGMGLEKSESKHKDSKGSKDRNSDKSKEDETSSSPHPSFPLMYNPLLFNPALLAAQGLANFPLPTSLAGLDASYLNGHTPQKEEPSTSSRSSSSNSKSRTVTSDYSDHSRAEDLSIRSSSSKKSSKVVENTTIAHSASKPKLKMDASMDEDDMPCDLSMKPKSKEEKSKQKICSSDKLSRIVDSLKFRVNKMDEKPSRDEPDSRRHSMDAVLNLTDKSSDSKSKHSDSSSSKKDSLNSLSMKLGSSSSSSSLTSTSSNHKESVPKIVQELLAAKQQRDREELMAASKQTESPSKMKSLKESLLKRASSTQGSDIGDMEQDSDEENS